MFLAKPCWIVEPACGKAACRRHIEVEMRVTTQLQRDTCMLKGGRRVKDECVVQDEAVGQRLALQWHRLPCCSGALSAHWPTIAAVLQDLQVCESPCLGCFILGSVGRNPAVIRPRSTGQGATVNSREDCGALALTMKALWGSDRWQVAGGIKVESTVKYCVSHSTDSQ